MEIGRFEARQLTAYARLLIGARGSGASACDCGWCLQAGGPRWCEIPRRSSSWPVPPHVWRRWWELEGVLICWPARDNANHTFAMRLPILIAGLLACLVTDVAATALTYKIGANENACFFTTTKKEGEKVAFYFAVSFLAV